jgi:hypothetical protein
LLFSFVVGAVAALTLVVVAMFNTKAAIALIVCIPAAILLASKPHYVVLLFVFCLLVFEEFPSGVGETLERSQRTTFYSLSLGIPGLYSTDVFLLVALVMYFLRTLLLREALPWVNNKITTAIIILALTSFICTSYSILFNNAINFSTYYDVALSDLGDFNQAAAALIGFFHMKIFSYLFFSYVLGLYFFQSPDNLQLLLKLILFALGVNILVGFIRIALNPGLITSGLPLFYHSPTSWIFSIAIFYFMGQWSAGYISAKRAAILGPGCALLFAFILLSLRRTMWGAMFVASIFFLLLTAAHERKRLYGIASMGLIFVLSVLLLTPIGHAVLSRAEATNVNDASSFYRLLLFAYFIRSWTDVPLLGYGVKPLWNFQDASVGYFKISLENIHSLYFWILLRFGILGFISTLFASFLIAYEAMKIKWIAGFGPERWLVICVILALIMLLFSGLFNPVYGEARYMVLSGLALAMLSQLPHILESGKVERADENSSIGYARNS